jgi:hypothetical protein
MNTGMKKGKRRLLFKTYDSAAGKIDKEWLNKEKRCLWWKSLTPENQQEYIEKKQIEKKGKREDKLKLFKAKTRFNCMNCIHHKTGNCKEIERAEDKVCKSFANPELFNEPIKPIKDICGAWYYQREA